MSNSLGVNNTKGNSNKGFRQVDRRQFKRPKHDDSFLDVKSDEKTSKSDTLQTENIDLSSQPIKKEDLIFYNNPTILFGEKGGHGHSAPKKYLTFKSLCFLAVALDRQITKDDLRILIKDEGLKKCDVLGEKRRAMSWIFLGKQVVNKIKRLTGKGLSLNVIVSEHLYFEGSFYFCSEKSKRFVFISGSLFPERGEYSPLRRRLNKTKTYGVDSHAAIRIANERR